MSDLNLSQLKALFTRVILPGNENERTVALTKLVRLIQSSGLHPSDIHFSVASGMSLADRQMAIIRRFEEESKILLKEINYFRSKASPEELRKAARLGQIEDRWEPFLSLVERKLCDKDGNLPRNWRKIIADTLSVTPRVISSWEDLRATVPQEAIDAVSALPDSAWVEAAEQRQTKRAAAQNAPVPESDPVEHKGRRANRPDFIWEKHPDVHRKVVKLFLDGYGGKYAIARAVGWVSEEIDEPGVPHPNNIQSITINGAPPEFLNAQVRDTGPLDWPEAWLIARTVFHNKSWLSPLLTWLRIKAHGEGLSYDLSTIDPEVVFSLRDMYRQTMIQRRKKHLNGLRTGIARSERAKRAEREIAEKFRAAGENGSTLKDLPGTADKKTDGHQRLSDLVRVHTIFPRGTAPGGAMIYVHRDFAHRWPDEWNIATGGAEMPPDVSALIMEAVQQGKSARTIVQNLKMNHQIQVTSAMVQRVIAEQAQRESVAA